MRDDERQQHRQRQPQRRPELLDGGKEQDDAAEEIAGVRFVDYESEAQLGHVMSMVGRDLSEPYSSELRPSRAERLAFFPRPRCMWRRGPLSHPFAQHALTHFGSFSVLLPSSILLSPRNPSAVFTYRYFLHRFPQLCILAVNEADEPIGCVVGKIDEEEVVGDGFDAPSPLDAVAVVGEADPESEEAAEAEEAAAAVTTTPVGYIGMLAVTERYRRRGIGKALVRRILRRMRAMGCTSATLETEVTNRTAGRLYHDFGFVREEFLVRYYLNWNDAYRLRLWF